MHSLVIGGAGWGGQHSGMSSAHTSVPPASPEPPQPTELLHPVAPGKPATGRDRYIPFVEHLGFVREKAEDGLAVVSLELRPELCNNHGGGHGGVVMTLLDSAMANAALSKIDFDREVVTIDMHIAFMRPSTGKLTATGRAVGGGKSVCFCEAEITDAHGHAVARAMGTFRYRRPGGTHQAEHEAG